MSSTADGIIDKPGKHSVDETAEKLQAILRAKGIALFALVDHSGEAAKAGMKMRPTKLLIFGNPKAGTPLMQASPSIAIDLPLKILIWEDAAGQSLGLIQQPYVSARETPSAGGTRAFRAQHGRHVLLQFFAFPERPRPLGDQPSLPDHAHSPLE